MNLSRPSVEKLFELVSKSIVPGEPSRIYVSSGRLYFYSDNICLLRLEKDGGWEVGSHYWTTFPYNNPNASEERKLEDLIDTIWYECCCKDVDPFKTSNGNWSEQSKKTFRERIEENKWNHAFISLLKRCPYKRSFGFKTQTLDIPVVGNYDNTVIIEGQHYFGFPEEASYLYTTLGYVWEDDQWVKPGVTCSGCGNKFRSGLFKGKCLKCNNLREEDIQIHSYSTKVPTLLEYKGKIPNKPLKTKKNFSSYYNKYLSELSIEHSKRGAEDTPLYLGLELEYEKKANVKDKDAEIAVMSMLKGHAILKSDGSINNGFEIVTCPATFEEHKDIFHKFFSEFPKEYIYAGENCGLHVHVSRAPLSLLTQGRMIAFMNNPDNKRFLEQLAGRWSERWASIDSNRGLSYVLNSTDSRYNTLNTVNRDTLEFRMFAPAETWDKFIYKLEFCVALIDYCTPCNTQYNSIDIKTGDFFVAWLVTNQKQYPELSKFIFGEKKKPEVFYPSKGKKHVYSYI